MREMSYKEVYKQPRKAKIGVACKVQHTFKGDVWCLLGWENFSVDLYGGIKKCFGTKFR